MRSRAAAGRYGGPPGSQGQALLLAVIVMLLILLIGALFVALVSFKQAGSVRFGQKSQAGSTALTGVDYADHQLMYSPEGADWRPPAPDWGPDGVPGTPDDTYTEFDVQHGWANYTKYPVAPDYRQSPAASESYFLLKLDYQPGPPAYIVIDSVSVVEGDTPAYTRRTAYKAVPLVSFGRFVTDFDRGGEHAVMGVPSTAPRGSLLPGLTSAWTGFHYYNVPVDWRPWGVNTFTAVQEIWAPQCNEQAGAGDQAAPPAAIVMRDGSTRGTAAPQFKVSRIEGPDLGATDPLSGQHRLRAATRDSGALIGGSSGAAFNQGEYGWGAGIYVDNFDDVQFITGYRCPICGRLRTAPGGEPALEPGPCTTPNCPGVATRDHQVRDLNRLRQNWMRAGKTSAADPNLDVGWNSTREWYEPKDQYGRDAWVKVTLYPTEAATNAAAAVASAPWPVHAAGLPGILIERSSDGPNWRLNDGSDSGVKTMVFDYPVSGLIFAEGNVRVKGNLPPSSPNRDFSVTICSGATAYIDGNILTPENTGIGVGTRLALLAEDYVCFNPTQLTAPLDVGTVDPSAVQEGDPSNGWYFALKAGESLGLTFSFGAPPVTPVNLVAKQCAADDSLETDISLRLNGIDYDFADQNLSTAPYEPYFRFVVGLVGPNISNSFHPQYEQLSNALNPTVPWRLDTVLDAGGNPAFNPAVGGANTLMLGNWGQSQYCLKRFKIEELSGGAPTGALHTTINAALYAQKGSFFVIPGTYFDPTTLGTAQEARFGRYDYDTHLVGAVAEEHPAPSSDAYQWMDKWSYLSGGAWTQPWVAYDPSLTTPRVVNANQLPKLPRLPLGPGFVYEGIQKG